MLISLKYLAFEARLQEKTAIIRDLQHNAHTGCNTLRALILPVSASVDQTTPVNHTCSFTDACVGGSESKITERLSVNVAMWVSVFVAEKWKLLCEA